MPIHRLSTRLYLVAMVVLASGLGSGAHATAGTNAPSGGQAEEKLGLATAMRKAENYTKAEPLLKQVLQQAPDNAAAWRQLGLVYANTGRPKQAIDAYTRSSKLAPKDAWPIYLRGRVHLAQQRPDLAIRDLDHALKLDPKLSYAYHYRAEARAARGDNTGALSDYGRVLALRPYRVRTYLARARLYAELGMHNEALGDFVTIKTLAPNHPKADSWVRSLRNKVKLEPVQQPAPYAPPAKGLRIQYLETLAKAETVEDMIAWFKPGKVNRPKPKKRRRNQRVLGTTRDGVTPATLYALHSQRPPRRVATHTFYRAIWPMQQRGPNKTTFDLVPDRKAIDSLWPLQAGKQASGTDQMIYRCPAPLDPVAQRLGCKQAGKVIQVGSFRWSAKLMNWDKLATPSGLHQTMKISISGTMTVDVPGRKHSRRSSRTIWFSPALGWWVKRSAPRGPDEYLVQAMRIMRSP